MTRLEKPKGLTINFKPSERQYELWNALQPNRCDKCGGSLEMRPSGYDAKGHTVYKATCVNCGNTDIPEQILSGGAAGGGKGQMLDAEIITPFGVRRFGDLKVGDTITSALTGGITEVIYLHPIETRDYYRVTFVDGTHVDCSDNHIWRLHQSKARSKKAKKYPEYAAEYGTDELMTAEAMYEWYQKKKSGMYDGVNLIIPLCAPVQFTVSTKQYVHPYIAGAMIGNGCMTEGTLQRGICHITTLDSELIEKFEKLGVQYSYISECGRASTYVFRDEKFINNLIKSELGNHSAIDKFIPRRYKLGTIEERKELMMGLMDTDGYIDDRGHMSYCTISKQLAEDVAFVVRSLGGVATITEKENTGYKDQNGNFIKTNVAYIVWIRTKFDPELVYVPRKKKRARYEFNGGNSELGKRIVDVEYIGKREGRCITVKEPSGLYLTNNFTVTHNSFLGCCWLIYSCMQFSGIRMVVARKVRKTLLETTWRTLHDVLTSWGLKEDVNYHINNQTYTVTFWNGSTIMALDLTAQPSDPDFNSLGSLEITGAFVDEVSEVSEKAIEVLASRIRYKIEDTFIVGKCLMSSNPAITWIRNTFVMDDDGNPAILQPGYRYIPFSLFDNPNESFRRIYYNKLSKIRDKSTRDRLLYGNWWFVEGNKMAAYWNFDGEKALKQQLYELRYDPLKPLILSFDFNVNPYMTCLPMQVDYENKIFYVFPEFIGRSKDKLNNTPSFSRWIAKSLVEWGHAGGVLVTGDPAGLARSTQTEEGVNNFTIVMKNLEAQKLRPKLQLLSKQPAQTTRLEFVNELFSGYSGWSIQIDIKCRRLTEDFVYQKKNPDGTKEKKKVVMDSGERAERYGHASDCFDYALVYYLGDEYTRYRTSNTDIVTTIGADEMVYGEFDY